ncbi:hypothetical protein GOV06_00925 [Candidatus Woesearchaeota archaeon]|nr:hypothetical protein [Candidatus Woesearchaeota archaeon]
MKKLLIVFLILLISGCEYIEEDVAEEVPVVEEVVEEVIKEKHWTHMPVTYSIDEGCGDYETRKIEKGFFEIENATNGIVYFEKADFPADIDVSCSFLEDCYKKWVDIRKEQGVIYRYETICNHTKGKAQIMAIRGNDILKARIEMIGLAGFSETNGKGMSGFYIGSCGYATTEIHEILHTFGFGHIDDPDSIMYYAEDGVGYTMQDENACVGSRKKVDKEIVDKLVEIYSSEKFK